VAQHDLETRLHLGVDLKSVGTDLQILHDRHRGKDAPAFREADARGGRSSRDPPGAGVDRLRVTAYRYLL
jgi:hypothetical protein